jgi:predicted DNA-binding transcriptional regulator AlpA
MLDGKQLSRLLKVSTRTIGRWRKERKLPQPIVDDPKKPFWSFGQIEDWVEYRKSEKLAMRDFRRHPGNQTT